MRKMALSFLALLAGSYTAMGQDSAFSFEVTDSAFLTDNGYTLTDRVDWGTWYDAINAVNKPMMDGWTLNGKVSIIKSGSPAWASPAAAEGEWLLGLHHIEGATVSRDMSGLTPGRKYRLSWQYRHRQDYPARTLNVFVAYNGLQATLGGLSTTLSWTQEEMVFTAESEVVSIRFTDAGGNDGTTFLDDVEFVEVGDDVVVDDLEWTIAANLANGSFELQSGAPVVGDWFDVSNSNYLYNWSTAGVVQLIPGTSAPWSAPGTKDGNMLLVLHDNGASTATTTLTSLGIGSEYSLSWWYRKRFGYGGKTLRVTVGGEMLFDEPVESDDWAQRSVTFVASSTFATLEFHDAGNNGDGSVFLDALAIARIDCAGTPNGDAKVDRCGVCNGSNDCVDCNDVVDGGAVVDECGVCGGDGSSCAEAAREPVPDGGACDLALPASTTCPDCERYYDPRPGYGDTDNGKCVWVAEKGLCFPKSWASRQGWTFIEPASECPAVADTVDCAGVTNGDAEVDECGVCGGDNSSCADCAGEPNGNASLDDCGVCNGDNACITLHSTGCNEIWDKNAEFLDRHEVKCPDGKALQYWKLMSHLCGNGAMRFEYSCKTVFGGMGAAVDRNSGCHHLRGQKLEYLDRQNVQCAANEVMQGFKLNGCGGDNMSFHIWCRGLADAAITSTQVQATGCNHINGQYLQNLDRHTLQCGNNASITQWQLKGDGCGGADKQIFYTCATVELRTDCDWNCYLDRYSDLKDVYGDDLYGAQQHYYEFGKGEGRDCYCHDCAGTPNGDAVVDRCGVCGGTDECVDCNDVVNGGASVDRCGVCGGTDECVDCNDEPNGGAVVDECGVCGGDESSCQFERLGDNVCKGNGQSDLRKKKFDGVTAAWCRQSCLDNVIDERMCWGYKSFSNGRCYYYMDPVTEVKGGVLGTAEEFHCHRKKDCAGVFGGDAVEDLCGVCDGDGSTCTDECGVPDGDNACLDCNGVANGVARTDPCGVCGGDASTCDDMFMTWEHMEAFCNASASNCKKCKGKDATTKHGHSYCKISRKKTRKCNTWKKEGESFCNRVTGCTMKIRTKKSGKQKKSCAGKADLSS